MKNIKILKFEGKCGELQISVCFCRQSCAKYFEEKQEIGENR